MKAKLTAYALVVIAALAAAGSAYAGREGSSVGALKLCTFVSANDNNSTPTDNVKIQVVGGKGHIGTVNIQGVGLNATAHFTLSKAGIAITPFAVTNPGAATITVKLARMPAKTRTLHVMLSSAATGTGAAGCTPH